MSRQTLYRFFDAGGALLYVGIARHGFERWQQHQSMQPWWGEVASATIEHYASREEVVQAEKDAIVREDPRHNVVHTARHPELMARWRARALPEPPTRSPFAPQYDEETWEKIRRDAEARCWTRMMRNYLDGSFPRRFVIREIAHANENAPLRVDQHLALLRSDDPQWSRRLRGVARVSGVEWSEEQPEVSPLTVAVADGFRRREAEREAEREARFAS